MCMLPSLDAAWGSDRSPAPQAMHHQVGTAAYQPGSALRRGRAAGREAGAPDLGRRRRRQLLTLQRRRCLPLPMGRGAAGRGRSQVGLCAGCSVASSSTAAQGRESCRRFCGVLDVLQDKWQPFFTQLPAEIRARKQCSSPAASSPFKSSERYALPLGAHAHSSTVTLPVGRSVRLQTMVASQHCAEPVSFAGRAGLPPVQGQAVL